MIPDNLSSISKAILIGAALVILIAGLRSASEIISPLLLAIFISIVCTPPLFMMQQRGIPTSVAMVIILALVGLLGIAVLGLITNASNEFSQSLPKYKSSLGLLYVQLNTTATQWGYTLPMNRLTEQINPDLIVTVLNYMLNGISSLLANGLFVFLAVLFILAEVAGLSDKLESVLTDPETSMIRLRHFTRKVIRYLALKAATSALTAFCVALVLWLLNIDYLFLWAVLAFFLNFIPYVGSLLAGLPAVILALLDHGLLTTVWVIVGYAAINIVIGNIIETRWMGEGLNLSSFVVFVSLIFWGWVLGPTGMFLAVPLTMLIMIALESDPGTKGMARLMQSK